MQHWLLSAESVALGPASPSEGLGAWGTGPPLPGQTLAISQELGPRFWNDGCGSDPLPPPLDRAQSPCFAGSGSYPHSWASPPSSLHTPHALHPRSGPTPQSWAALMRSSPDPGASLSCCPCLRLALSNDKIIVCFIDHDQPSVAQ